MELQDLKRWHWMLIGLLAGTMWASTQLFYGFLPDGRTIAGTFERVLTATEKSPAYIDFFETGVVYLSEIQIHPPIMDESPSEKTPTEKNQPAPQIQWVTGNMWNRRFAKNPQWMSHAFRYKASIPFAVTNQKFDFVTTDFTPNRQLKKVAGYSNPPTKSYPTLQAYFDELNRKYGSGAIKYRYIWWESRTAVMTVYPLGGLLLIGGVWPTIISLMVGAGLGGKPKPETFDLSRYQPGKTTEKPKAHQVTDQDRKRLDAINEELEKNLQPDGSRIPVTATTPTESVIRKLEGEPADASKPADQKPGAVKTFGATRTDFYPTEIHPDEKKVL